jgi:hypothetical protein
MGTTKSVLRLPDLEHAKAAVLNSLTSPDAQRGYRHAIDDHISSKLPEDHHGVGFLNAWLAISESR